MDWNNYSKKFYDKPDQILELENGCLARLINESQPRGKNCLDLGCGLGHWTNIMYKSGGKVIGVDTSWDAIKQCQAQLPNANFIYLDQVILPFPDSAFELILISWVLQEISNESDFSTFLSEAKRVLSTEGSLIISENVYPDARKLLQRLPQGHIFANKNGHPSKLRFFFNNSFVGIMKNYELSLIKRKMIGHSFFEIYRR